MVIGDASDDERFSTTAAVVDDPNIRFYAGVPIKAPGGEQIGALCVYDPTPREAGEVNEADLRRLGRLLETELKASKAKR
jgi:GAF domain-containing protein